MSTRRDPPAGGCSCSILIPPFRRFTRSITRTPGEDYISGYFSCGDCASARTTVRETLGLRRLPISRQTRSSCRLPSLPVEGLVCMSRFRQEDGLFLFSFTAFGGLCSLEWTPTAYCDRTRTAEMLIGMVDRRCPAQILHIW